MYKTYEFTFSDTPASLYGMFVADIGDKHHSDNNFGNQANIVETRMINRITPLHFGVRYHDRPLTFNLIFASEQYMDRYQLQEVSNWLTGYQDYQWLSIDQPDMEHIQFRCLIQKLTPISVGWYPIAFEAQVICDCAYGYSYPFEKTIKMNGLTGYCFYNDSTIKEHLKPNLKIVLETGCTNFSITNKTTDSVMRLSGLPENGLTINVDNENGVIMESRNHYDLYDYFNFQFFELASGDNDLIFEGVGYVTISGRYLYNVGA